MHTRLYISVHNFPQYNVSTEDKLIMVIVYRHQTNVNHWNLDSSIC